MAAEGRFVVVAEFDVRPGQREAFLALAEDDARASVRDEPGCRQFDVTQDADDPDRVLLYEVYDDRAAFDAHLATPHLERFRAKVDALVAGRRVRFLTRIVP